MYVVVEGILQLLLKMVEGICPHALLFFSLSRSPFFIIVDLYLVVPPCFFNWRPTRDFWSRSATDFHRNFCRDLNKVAAEPNKCLEKNSICVA